MATRHYADHGGEEESYFVSMTDVFIGLLFIFIIMLMFFAMRFQEATQTQNEVTQKLSIFRVGGTRRSKISAQIASIESGKTEPYTSTIRWPFTRCTAKVASMHF